MKDIGLFLKKYTNLTPPIGTKKRIILDGISHESGITLTEQQISLQGSSVFLKCHPAQKSEILLHTIQIIEYIHTQFSVRITHIR